MRRVAIVRRFVLAPAAVAAVFTVLSGCAIKPLTPAQMEQGPLAFVQDGKMTKEQVVLELGPPTAQLEGDRILTYRIRHDAGRGLRVLPRENQPSPRVYTNQNQNVELVQYHLVLVFDDNHVLRRHRLVPIR